MIAGVDGFRGKWVAALEWDDGSTKVMIVKDIGALFGNQEFSHVVIDVPIGLPAKGKRTCDIEAKAVLGSKQNSVFIVPPRGVLKATSHSEMCHIWFEIDQRRGSKQLFGILPYIRNVDKVITPKIQERVREGHPEVSFAEMAGGAAMVHGKKTIPGVLDRLDLVEAHFAGAIENIRGVPNAAAAGDALDAYALLWTARRWRSGQAKTLPETPVADPRGLKMEILY